MDLSIDRFFDQSEPTVRQLLRSYSNVLDVVPDITRLAGQLVQQETIVRGRVASGAYIDERGVYVDTGAKVEPTAYIQGPCYIGKGAQVRHGAYIRGGVILLEQAILGHCSEAKNSLLLPDAKAPHFAYVGDSILGSRVNLGAGTKLSNLAVTSTKHGRSGARSTVKIQLEEGVHDSGLTKLGAIIGDGCQVGCNVVLNPGCLLGKDCLIYPGASVKSSFYDAGSIIKLRQRQELSRRMFG